MLQRLNFTYNMHKNAVPTSDKITVSFRKINILCCLQNTPLLLLRTKRNVIKTIKTAVFLKVGAGDRLPVFASGL